MARGDRRVEAAERRVGLGGGFLDEDGGGDEIGGRAQAADREVLDRARRLDAVVRVGGDLQLAERIALDAERPSVNYTRRAVESGVGPVALRLVSILSVMLPSFFDSVLQLIVRTSTDLPPDVRAAMQTARDERAGRDARVAGADDHRAEHRSRRRPRRRHLPGHRHADLRGQGAGRRQPDLDAAADPRGGRRSDQARQAAAELGRFDHRRELRQQPRTGHADHPLRSVGARRDRGQADSQGRRLREHQRAVRAAGRAAASRPRRPHARRRQEVHPARGVERAGQGLRPGRGRRLHRRRSHVRLHCTPRSSCSARSTTSIRIRGWPSSKRRSWRRSTRSTSARWASAAR